MITAMKSILSIQSSVTLGAVGNTMAAAVMAASAHLLCRVDTIQLTAHPGHGFRAGGSISNDDLDLNEGTTYNISISYKDKFLNDASTIAIGLLEFSGSTTRSPILTAPAQDAPLSTSSQVTSRYRGKKSYLLSPLLDFQQNLDTI